MESESKSQTDTEKFTVQNGEKAQTDADRRRLCEHASKLLEGDEVTVHFSSSSRSLTVEKEVVDADNFPECAAGRAARSEKGFVLSGYGTEYVLPIPEKKDAEPSLVWPSSGRCVWGISVDNRESEIRAEATASDLLWRVDRYGGR